MQRRVDRTAIPDGEWFRDGLTDIDNQTNRMSGQIDELLDLSRFGRAEPVELRRRPTDLVRVVRRVAAEQQKLSNRHQIRIEPSVPQITGQWDPERIERVVANLLGNALKYSPSGGEITVRISRERTTGLGDCAVLTVQDQGLGIPPDDLPFVFDQYRRGSNVTGRIAGSGIGLAGVRRIVEEHGGSIVAESEEGKGSCFTVRLPLEPLSTASTL